MYVHIKIVAMLRKVRITLAALSLVGITLLLLGFGFEWWGFLAKIQFLPALLRVIGGATLLNVLVVIAILLVTWLFGRIYCSVVCPLGIFQDIVIWISRRWGRLRNKVNANRLRKGKGRKGVSYLKQFRYLREHRIVRYGILAICIASWFLCGQVFISLIAPYSAYGRMVRGIAGIGSGDTPLALVTTALITLLAIVACSFLFGRQYCNTICPVGSLLSLLSRHSVWQISIDTDKCNGCGRCYRNCKAYCIDGEHHKIDASRCVDCFDCIDVCSGKAIALRPAWKRRKATEAGSGSKSSATTEASIGSANDSKAAGKGMNRRQFLGTAALIGTTALSAQAGELSNAAGGGLERKQTPPRKNSLLPPGSGSRESFYSHCTACQLCVSACPNGVLRPGTDPEHLLQPVMGYEKGYCRPECNACSQVCPSGAIRPFDKDAKTLQIIGTARVNPELCLAWSGEAGCGNCARHCPVGAISMIKDENGRRRPVVMEEQCIGCGACEHLCPARPISAIFVDSRD